MNFQSETAKLPKLFRKDDLFIVYAEKTGNLIAALTKCKKSTPEEKVIIWTNLIKSEEEELKNIEIYYSKVLDRINLIATTTPKIHLHTERLNSKFNELHSELLRHLFHLRELEGKEFDTKQEIDTVNKLDNMLADFMSSTFNDFDQKIFRLLFGYTFGYNKLPSTNTSTVTVGLKVSDELKTGIWK